MTRHHSVPVLPVVVGIVTVIGVRIARSQVLTICVRVELGTTSGSEITACARTGVANAAAATTVAPINAFILVSWLDGARSTWEGSFSSAIKFCFRRHFTADARKRETIALKPGNEEVHCISDSTVTRRSPFTN